jgi:tRNA (adenine22-N1)-methyltransferase
MVDNFKKLPKPKISPRMQYFVNQADANIPFWDFCCDHGYIGIAAMTSGKFCEVHFVDQIPHIIERLKKLFEQSPSKNIYDKYFFYDCGGENLNTNIQGNVIIAGVGGRTIVSILNSLISKNILAAQKIILSPHLDIKLMEDFCNTQLPQLDYVFLGKDEVIENNRARPIYIWIRK